MEPYDQDPATYYSILMVDVLLPYNLYNPVLPLRHGKLMLPLCRKCVEDEIAKTMLGRNYYSHGVKGLHAHWYLVYARNHKSC